MEITLVPLRGSWSLSCLDDFAAAIRVPRTAHPGHCTRMRTSEDAQDEDDMETGECGQRGRRTHRVEMNRSGGKGSGKTTSSVYVRLSSPNLQRLQE